MKLFKKYLGAIKKKIKPKTEICSYCKDIIDDFNENEYYRINALVYCGLECFQKDYKENTLKRKKK